MTLVVPGIAGTTADQWMPSSSAGTAMSNPPMGPAAAMSNRAFLSGVGDRIRMTAPSVPKDRKKSGGTGMKYGRLTDTP